MKSEILTIGVPVVELDGMPSSVVDGDGETRLVASAMCRAGAEPAPEAAAASNRQIWIFMLPCKDGVDDDVDWSLLGQSMMLTKVWSVVESWEV